MTVTEISKDPTALTMTVTSEWGASVESVWQLWADPRKLERWWGPPTYPATVVEHDLEPGGKVGYFMTGPEGDEHHGWWRVVGVEPLQRLDLEDGFADTDGNPDHDLPTRPTMPEQRVAPFPSRPPTETVGGSPMVAARQSERVEVVGVDPASRRPWSSDISPRKRACSPGRHCPPWTLTDPDFVSSAFRAASSVAVFLRTRRGPRRAPQAVDVDEELDPRGNRGRSVNRRGIVQHRGRRHRLQGFGNANREADHPRLERRLRRHVMRRIVGWEVFHFESNPLVEGQQAAVIARGPVSPSPLRRRRWRFPARH